MLLLLVALATTPPPDEDPTTRALSGATALTGGAIVHGAGHFVRGETDTGWRLLGMQGLGMLGTVGGLGALAITGAADDTVAAGALLAIHGVGLFSVSWLADLYGSVSAGEGSGRPQTRSAPLQLELGHRFIHDPVFEYTQLAVLGAEGRWRAGVLEARAWLALDDDNQRLRLRPTWRLMGPRPDRASADGSALDLRLGAVWHRYGTERFAIATGEAALLGRLDLHHIGRTLRGAFAEAEAGFAAGATLIEGLDAESTTMLLGGFAFGLYLGHARDGYGELALYYDHRHDGYLAGLKAVGLGSGVAGHFGLRASLGLWGPWGVALRGEVGSAWLGGLSVLYRRGGTR